MVRVFRAVLPTLRKYDRYVLLRWPGLWETYAHVVFPAGVAILFTYYAVIFLVSPFEQSRISYDSSRSGIPTLFFWQNPLQTHFAVSLTVSILLFICWWIVTGLRSGRRAVTTGCGGYSRFFGCLLVVLLVGSIPVVHVRAVVAIYRQKSNGQEVARDWVKMQLLVFAFYHTHPNLHYSSGLKDFSLIPKRVISVASSEESAKWPDEGLSLSDLEQTHDPRLEKLYQEFLKVELINHSTKSLFQTQPDSKAQAPQMVIEFFERVVGKGHDWIKFYSSGDFFELKSFIDFEARLHSLTGVWWDEWIFQLWGWLAAAQMLGFAVCYFQIADWAVAATAFGVCVAVTVGETLTMAFLSNDVLQDKTNFLIALAIPCLIYTACWGLVGLAIELGRAGFVSRVACYLAIWLASALPFMIVITYTRFCHGLHAREDAILYFRTAVVAIAAFGFIPQYVYNRVNALPQP
jgi:hypothetical protein